MCIRLHVCQLQNVVELKSRTLFPKKTLATGCTIDNPESLADVSPCSTPVSNHALTTYEKLCLSSARLKDLSKAFGQSRGYQASTARRTIQILNNSMKENCDGNKEEVKP